MKSHYVFMFSLVLLVAVACHNQDQESPATTFNTPSITSLNSKTTPNISLDSFQRTVSASVPVASAATHTRNKLLIRREKDSLTVSGIAFAAGEYNTHTAYRFYFRADEKTCYAYLKQEYSAPVNGLQQRSSREVGYCLHFFSTAG